MSIVLFSYKTTCKVTIRYTPYQLVYGLHPLMPTKYVILVASGNQRDNTLMRILTNRILESEKLQETRMQAIKLLVFSNGIKHHGVSK
jgi:hypothetical protein